MMSFGRTSNQLGFIPVRITHRRVATIPPCPYPPVPQIPASPRSNRRCISMVQSQDEEVESIAENNLLDLSSITVAQDDLPSSAIEINSRPLDDEAINVPIKPNISSKKHHQKSNKRRMQMFRYLSQPIVGEFDLIHELEKASSILLRFIIF